MSDLDFFENSNPEQQEDPAADFLAQEQNQLAGIDGEDFGFNQSSEQEPQEGQSGTKSHTYMLTFILFMCLIHCIGSVKRTA